MLERKGSILIGQSPCHGREHLNLSSSCAMKERYDSIATIAIDDSVNEHPEISTCSICLQKYKVGDDICWSQNESCEHAFHMECLTPWLMKHDNCPLCRENYLEVTE